MQNVRYRSNIRITAKQFIDLLQRSTLGERRPINDFDSIQKMLDHANVQITAWIGDELVGISRALTDFAFCCYLSDLAVDTKVQHQGIGSQLVKLTHQAAGERTMLILLAAPAAISYYPKIGMQKFEHCYIIPRKK